jgi:hypothetical protein
MNKEILQLEDSIIKLAASDNKTIHFEYDRFKEFDDEDYFHKVSVFTFNPTTKEHFLVKEVNYRPSFEVCLNEILDYMINMKVSHKSFTVLWTKLENGRLGKTNTSYFYCKNAKEVTDKFYHGKNEEEYEIYSIKLNPIS